MKKSVDDPIIKKGSHLFPFLLILAAGLCAYANSFSVPFILDDRRTILDENFFTRSLCPSWDIFFRRRCLVDISFAINHLLSKEQVWGYHLVNLTTHIAAATLLYGIVRRTLSGPTLENRFGNAAKGIALSAALIWTVHPLQSQSVTYISQRYELWMGFFYLLTLYTFLRGIQSTHKNRWLAVAVVTCAFGQMTKEVMITAPIAVLLYDRMFLIPSFIRIFRERGQFYLGLFSTWILSFIAVMIDIPSRNAAGFSLRGIHPLNYLLTQAEIIAHYLKLSIWPHPLCFDYQWPLAQDPVKIIPSAITVILLLAGTLTAYLKRHPIGYLGIWLILILAPTSSIFPIADIAVEHRMYLPLASVIIFVIVTGREVVIDLLRTAKIRNSHRSWIMVGIVSTLTATSILITHRRNTDYQSE
ncbi:MAG: glycosyltransferase family 39 protein, partial [Candidatus Omnitrophica bacterium]|nr:glycosyltransferase family 39 protein [Candidatus Omnitrophota bacterium]